MGKQYSTFEGVEEVAGLAGIRWDRLSFILRTDCESSGVNAFVKCEIRACMTFCVFHSKVVQVGVNRMEAS